MECDSGFTFPTLEFRGFHSHEPRELTEGESPTAEDLQEEKKRKGLIYQQYRL